MTWTAVATALGVDKRTLQAWRKRPDAPASPTPAEWRDYVQRASLRCPSNPDAQVVEIGDVEIGANGLPGACPYDDAVLGGMITYGDAEKREKVIRQSLENERERISLARVVGDMVDRHQVRDTLREMRDRWSQHLTALPHAIDALIGAAMPIEHRSAAKAAALQAVADMIDAMKK